MKMNDVVRNTSSRLKLTRWSTFKFLFSGWFGRAGLAIPIIGYAIILGDQTNSFFSLDASLGENDGFLLIGTSTRSKLLYAGMIVILISCVLFHFYCPRPIKLSTNRFTYIQNGMNNFAPHDFYFVIRVIRRKYYSKLSGFDKEIISNPRFSDESRIQSALTDRASSGDYISRMRSMLSVYYYHENKSRRTSLMISVFISVVGYCMMMFPSLDVFQAIVRIALS